MSLQQADPKGLIRESFRIDGISDAECRSIFMDWALSLPPNCDSVEAMRTVLVSYDAPNGHPMTQLLNDGLVQSTQPARRTRRAARPSSHQS
ncbi:hypothetical protein BFP70_15515 [Thioclava sp. SK-1]|uniref:hypothetical protein n=1 Tax=Thioclava sp. SK-1 TaxID=1889770 RepID=UPI000825628E|nr:hypothetical protein [Thioclava sp. SK-1]OCX61430.1 hypothetical protein BFP70_15515 [Thioclava sp. SK-1]